MVLEARDLQESKSTDALAPLTQGAKTPSHLGGRGQTARPQLLSQPSCRAGGFAAGRRAHLRRLRLPLLPLLRAPCAAAALSLVS